MTPAKITLSLCLAAGIFAAVYMTNRQPVAAATSSNRQVLYYACPMHPQYRSDHPGDAPCCGMRLEPVYAGGGGTTDSAASSPAGTVQVSASSRQLIGVRTDVVQRASTSEALRVPGRIAAEDARVYKLVAATDGWIRELGPNQAGTFVKQNEVLASYYVKDLLVSEQNYLYRFDAISQSAQAQPNSAPQRNSAEINLRAALDVLLSLGMTDPQIQDLQRTHKPGTEVRLYAPASGFVMARGVSPGQRFDKGSELYTIADISHVWVMADIFEKDREFIKPGTAVNVSYRGRELTARMTDALPQFDAQSRTLKTRFELDNPGFLLRPDMFVDIEIPVTMSAAITVPADAVIDSGRRKTVYVDRGDGSFEPRLVKTGWRLGERIQVTEGLEPGDRIVVAGNFLIDSESRMKLATASAPATARDPVCGMDVDPKPASAIHTQHEGTTYTFCSENCRRGFEVNPGQYVSKKRSAPSDMAMRGAE